MSQLDDEVCIPNDGNVHKRMRFFLSIFKRPIVTYIVPTHQSTSVICSNVNWKKNANPTYWIHCQHFVWQTDENAARSAIQH